MFFLQHCFHSEQHIFQIGVLKTYLIVFRPIFDTNYKGKNRSKNTYEFYIKNWSYSYKVGFFFTMYKAIRHMTGSIPRCPLQSHYLVHRENNSYFVGIGPICDIDLICIFDFFVCALYQRQV